jgi:hypothetical protein
MANWSNALITKLLDQLEQGPFDTEDPPTRPTVVGDDAWVLFLHSQLSESGDDARQFAQAYLTHPHTAPVLPLSAWENLVGYVFEAEDPFTSSTFWDIFTHEPDQAVRLRVAKKVHDQDMLHRMATQIQDWPVRYEALSRIENPGALYDALCETKNSSFVAHPDDPDYAAWQHLGVGLVGELSPEEARAISPDEMSAQAHYTLGLLATPRDRRIAAENEVLSAASATNPNWRVRGDLAAATTNKALGRSLATDPDPRVRVHGYGHFADEPEVIRGLIAAEDDVEFRIGAVRQYAPSDTANWFLWNDPSPRVQNAASERPLSDADAFRVMDEHPNSRIRHTVAQCMKPELASGFLYTESDHGVREMLVSSVLDVDTLVDVIARESDEFKAHELLEFVKPLEALEEIARSDPREDIRDHARQEITRSKRRMNLGEVLGPEVYITDPPTMYYG